MWILRIPAGTASVKVHSTTFVSRCAWWAAARARPAIARGMHRVPPAAASDLDLGPDQPLQVAPPVGALGALDARDLEEPRQLRVQPGEPEDPLDLIPDPLVVGDRVGAPGDEERLEEFLEGVAEAAEGLGVKPAL